MPNFSIDFSGYDDKSSDIIEDNVVLAADDTEQAELFARDYIRDVWPELINIELTVEEIAPGVID